MLGVEFPICAFSHCRDVVAAVTNAGGFGVLGAVAHSPERLRERADLDRGADGRQAVRRRPAVAAQVRRRRAGRDRRAAGPRPAARRASRVRRGPAGPLRHRGTATRRTADRPRASAGGLNISPKGYEPLLDVAFAHDIRLIASALGPPPRDLVDRAHDHDVLVAALAGTTRTRAPARRGGRRPDRRAGHRGRGPHRRGGDDGAGARSRGRSGADARAGRRRHRPWPSDRRGAGAGCRGRVVRVGVADHRGGRDAAGGQGQVPGRQLLGHGAVAVDDGQARADAAHRLDRRVGAARTLPIRSACRCRPR